MNKYVITVDFELEALSHADAIEDVRNTLNSFFSEDEFYILGTEPSVSYGLMGEFDDAR